ncbi:hypothetical protein MBLNU230_g3342t1 [Neophaeotheca triangularis]
MSKQTDAPDLGKLSLEDDTEDLFSSPATTQKHTPQTTSTSNPNHKVQSQQNDTTTREARLRAELERVKEVNKTIEGVTASLTKAKDNMGTVHQAVDNASTLLATWTRILSQTEHNQRLILNPNWQGATQDVEDVENEELRKQQESERRTREEERRREEAARRADEEERRKAVEGPKTGTRARGRGTRAGSTAGRLGASGTMRGRSTPTSSARGSGIGRGTSVGTRGRGRGLG